MSKCPFCGGPAPSDTLPCTIREAADLTDESGRMKYSDKDGTWLLSTLQLMRLIDAARGVKS